MHISFDDVRRGQVISFYYDSLRQLIKVNEINKRRIVGEDLFLWSHFLRYFYKSNINLNTIEIVANELQTCTRVGDFINLEKVRSCDLNTDQIETVFRAIFPKAKDIKYLPDYFIVVAY